MLRHLTALGGIVLALLLCSTALASQHHHHHHHHHHQHSRFTPNWGAAHYWTTRYFGRNTWQTSLMMCIANRESHYILAATHQNYPTSYGVDYGPWQVNQPSHPWVNFYRIVRSWRYAAAVAWHLSGRGTDFSPWGGRC